MEGVSGEKAPKASDSLLNSILTYITIVCIFSINNFNFFNKSHLEPYIIII